MTTAAFASITDLTTLPLICCAGFLKLQVISIFCKKMAENAETSKYCFRADTAIPPQSNALMTQNAESGVCPSPGQIAVGQGGSVWAGGGGSSREEEMGGIGGEKDELRKQVSEACLLYTSPSPRD